MQPYDQENIFAKILRGQIPCDKVLETDHSLAFRDINPAAKSHVLLIPKGAYVSSADFCAKASPEELVDFNRALIKIAEQENLLESGYRLVSNHGEDAHQEVPHYHVHILGGQSLRGGVN